MKWTSWVAKRFTEKGDDIILEYRDATLAATNWEPAEYYIEYKRLLVNEHEVTHDIEGALESLMEEYELELFFRSAEFDPED